MELSNDIRDDPVYTKDKQFLSETLASGLPLAVDGVPYDTSGFDCLVWVIRSMHSFMVARGDLLFTAERRKQEAAMPFLSYMWRSFPDEDGISQDEIEAEALAKTAAIEALIAHGPVDKRDLSFSALAGCPFMNELYWSRPEFALFFTAVQDAVGGPYLPLRPSGGASAEKDVLRFDPRGQPGMTVQQCINDSQGRFPREKHSGLNELRAYAKPAFFRVLYTNDPGHPLSFKRLWIIEFPSFPLVGRPGGAVDWNSMAATYDTYRLVAMVRLRRRPSEVDKVAVFRRNGSQIAPAVTSPAVWDDSWDVADAVEGQYMLFYVWSPVTDVLLFQGSVATDSRTRDAGQDDLDNLLGGGGGGGHGAGSETDPQQLKVPGVPSGPMMRCLHRSRQTMERRHAEGSIDCCHA